MLQPQADMLDPIVRWFACSGDMGAILESDHEFRVIQKVLVRRCCAWVHRWGIACLKGGELRCILPRGWSITYERLCRGSAMDVLPEEQSFRSMTMSFLTMDLLYSFLALPWSPLGVLPALPAFEADNVSDYL